MEFLSIILIAVSLAADAFVISLTTGVAVKEYRLKFSIILGLYFGIFQMMMPIIGFFVAYSFYGYIADYDHWIVFVLLSFIGGKMIYESFQNDEISVANADILAFKNVIPLAVATSLDALAIGVSFAFMSVDVVFPAVVIGVVTFFASAAGVFIGNKIGCIFKRGAEVAGGLILIALGIKILIEHLG